MYVTLGLFSCVQLVVINILDSLYILDIVLKLLENTIRQSRDFHI